MAEQSKEERAAAAKAKEEAAERRDDYVRALKEERAGLEARANLDDDAKAARLKAVDAELARMKSPSARRTPEREEAAAK